MAAKFVLANGKWMDFAETLSSNFMVVTGKQFDTKRLFHYLYVFFLIRHGCKSCMAKRQRLTADGILTASEAYQRTVDRKQALEAMG